MTKELAIKILTGDVLGTTEQTHEAVAMAVKALSALSSAERHGRWLEHKDYPGLAYLCSECNLFTTDRSFYCPHCGAKMDEVE